MSDGVPCKEEDIMESHIEKIRCFKAMSSPAYMAMTYAKDPVEHAFDFTKQVRYKYSVLKLLITHNLGRNRYETRARIQIRI